jgi:hypothetical protein
MIAKIYNNQFSENPIAIIDEIFELQMDLNINQWNRWRLVCPYFEWAWDSDTIWWAFENFQALPYSKINFFEIKDGKDIFLFWGFIYEPEITNVWIEFEIRDENDLMNRKLVLSDKTYTNRTPAYILNDITSDWQTETEEDWKVVSSVSETITIDFNKWDTFFSVLSELSDQLGYNWIVKNQTIYFDEVVWEDKTSGPNFEELVYNNQDPAENNIINTRLRILWTSANMIMGSNSTTKLLLKDIDERGAIAEFISLRDWNLTTQTQQILDLKKWPLFNYVIEIDNVPNINIWDKVACRIENTRWLDFIGDVIVNRTQLQYINAELLKTIEVETQIFKKNLLSTRLQAIERNLNLLLKK